MSLSQFQSIRHFIFDIDGVLTNGQLLISVEGNLLRSMNIKDGYAMQLALKQGYTISIISGAREESILKRLAGLGIHDVHLGISQKLIKLEEIANNRQLSLPHTLYMGDDMPDLEVMKHGDADRTHAPARGGVDFFGSAERAGDPQRAGARARRSAPMLVCAAPVTKAIAVPSRARQHGIRMMSDAIFIS